MSPPGSSRLTPVVPAHVATTRHLCAAYPLVAEAGLGHRGVLIGRDVLGGSFVYDPFELYLAGVVTNPNMVVIGQIGRGKSSFVKSYLWRQAVFGRSAWVIDPKGEYGALARSYGVRVVALGKDGWCDPFAVEERECRDFIRVLIATAQGTPLSAQQHYEIDEAFVRLPSPRPLRLVRALYHEFQNAIGSEVTAQRDVALTLYRFVHGDLAGLFDGEGDPLVFEGDLVVLDLSAQWSSESLSVAALSAVGAAQQMIAHGGALGYLVLDEAWALLSDSQALRWLQGSWKLARSRGLSHILVLHRWSDVAAVGNEGSAERERAQGLLRECETAWLFRQPADEAREMTLALGLSPREAQYLVALPKGAALVRYGAHRSIVRVTPDRRDVTFIDTDAAMRGTR